MADETYWVREAPPKDSYLNLDKILGIARISGAEAIHPGYGFLSENPAFAQTKELGDIAGELTSRWREIKLSLHLQGRGGLEPGSELLGGVLDLYYAIALISLPSKCRMS